MKDLYIPEDIFFGKTFASTEGTQVHTTETVETPPQGGFPFWIIAVGLFVVAGALLAKGAIDLIYDKYYKGSIMKGLI